MSKQAWLDEILVEVANTAINCSAEMIGHKISETDAEVRTRGAITEAVAAINAKFDEAVGLDTEVGSQYWKEGFNTRGARARKAWYTQEAEEPAA